MRSSASLCTLLLLVACGPQGPDEAYVDHDLEVARQGLSVGSAGGCDTSIVQGLTEQLVAELNCIAPNTMVDFRGPGITLSGAVQPYLNPAAAAALKTAVSASGTDITLSSAYRSVAQQYLLLKWHDAGQCGIQAAAKPGASNHQSGRAVDVPSYNFWISKLQAQGWTWFGSGDLVHFDFLSAPNLGSNSVLAFQRLWNKNNANKLDEDGVWGPASETAMEQSPTTGFASFGCGTTPPPPGQKGTLKGRVYEVNLQNPTDLSRGIATASVSVGGQTLSVDVSGNYSIDLMPGTYTVQATAGGFGAGSLSRMVVAGQTVWGSVGLTPSGTPDTLPPTVELVAPANFAKVDVAQVSLSGTASDAEGTVASLTLSVNGGAAQPVQVSQGSFSQAVHLQPGSNALRFSSTDDRGNAGTFDATLIFNTGVDGVVLSAAGSVPAAQVTATDAHGKAVSVQTAGDGTFHFDLLPGSYRLSAHAPELSLLDVPFVVGVETRESATLTLMPDTGGASAPDFDGQAYGQTCAATPGLFALGALALLLRARAATARRRRSAQPPSAAC